MRVRPTRDPDPEVDDDRSRVTPGSNPHPERVTLGPSESTPDTREASTSLIRRSSVTTLSGERRRQFKKLLHGRHRRCKISIWLSPCERSTCLVLDRVHLLANRMRVLLVPRLTGPLSVCRGRARVAASNGFRQAIKQRRDSEHCAIEVKPRHPIAVDSDFALLKLLRPVNGVCRIALGTELDQFVGARRFSSSNN